MPKLNIMIKFQTNMKYFFIFFILNTVSFINLMSQNTDNQVNNLVVLFDKLKYSKLDSDIIYLSKQIDSVYIKLLNDKKSFSDSLTELKKFSSILKSENNKVRIITWNIFLSTGIYKYFGYIQFYNEKSEEYFFTKLSDLSDELENPQMLELTDKNWYGCLYYEIITNYYKNNYYYTLIGWDGNNSVSNKKIIDVLSIKNNKVAFGFDFILNEKKYKRIIFEYNERASMLLRWDKKKKMIIFDHLAPESPKYEGMYEFYGPDFSYDAIEFKKGQWVLLEDVKVVNPKEEN